MGAIHLLTRKLANVGTEISLLDARLQPETGDDDRWHRTAHGSDPGRLSPMSPATACETAEPRCRRACAPQQEDRLAIRLSTPQREPPRLPTQPQPKAVGLLSGGEIDKADSCLGGRFQEVSGIEVGVSWLRTHNQRVLATSRRARRTATKACFSAPKRRAERWARSGDARPR
jgi:hypothetical protein